MGTTCSLPWKRWYGDASLDIAFLSRWQVTVARMADAPAIGDEDLRKAIAEPIGCPPLRELAAGRKNACILIDDLSRPTEGARLAPPVLDALREGGLADEHIFFLVANGAHRPQTHEDLVKKLGPDIVRRYVIYNHSVFDNLVGIGATRSGNEVLVNRFFHEADLKVSIGSLTPHPQAGFGGGGKMVLPGACGIETIARSHRYTALNPTHQPGRVGRIEGNALRAEIDETAVKTGLEFVICSVHNSRSETAGVFAGHPIQAHRAGVRAAQRVYATDVPYHNDAAIFNAYPKDTELILALNSLDVWVERNDPRYAVVRQGGAVVIVTAATEGVGYHELIGIGFRQFVRRDKHATFGGMIRDRRVIFLCPTVSEAAFYQHYPRGVLLCRDWAGTRAQLEQHLPGAAQVCVFPNSVLQLDREFLSP